MVFGNLVSVKIKSANYQNTIRLKFKLLAGFYERIMTQVSHLLIRAYG